MFLSKTLKSSAARFANTIPHPPPRPRVDLCFSNSLPSTQINVSLDLCQDRQIQSSSAALLWIVEDDDRPSLRWGGGAISQSG